MPNPARRCSSPADGEYAGLLSGGCLEGDLREHAREVAATGQARIVSYDLRSTTDQLFGLGAGCEGAMDILLTRVSARRAAGSRSLAMADELTRARTRARHFAFVDREPADPADIRSASSVARAARRHAVAAT